MNAVLKQSLDVLNQILPAAVDRDTCLSQTLPLLELQSPSLFHNGSKNLLIPNPPFAMPLLNIPPVTLSAPNPLGSLYPTALNQLLMPTGHLMRIKGMPPGTTVNDILNFLGSYWHSVALHGIHLIYTATVNYNSVGSQI